MPSIFHEAGIPSDLFISFCRKVLDSVQSEPNRASLLCYWIASATTHVSAYLWRIRGFALLAKPTIPQYSAIYHTFLNFSIGRCSCLHFLAGSRGYYWEALRVTGQPFTWVLTRWEELRVGNTVLLAFESPTSKQKCILNMLITDLKGACGITFQDDWILPFPRIRCDHLFRVPQKGPGPGRVAEMAESDLKIQNADAGVPGPEDADKLGSCGASTSSSLGDVQVIEQRLEEVETKDDYNKE